MQETTGAGGSDANPNKSSSSGSSGGSAVLAEMRKRLLALEMPQLQPQQEQDEQHGLGSNPADDEDTLDDVRLAELTSHAGSDISSFRRSGEGTVVTDEPAIMSSDT